MENQQKDMNGTHLSFSINYNLTFYKKKQESLEN